MTFFVKFCNFHENFHFNFVKKGKLSYYWHIMYFKTGDEKDRGNNLFGKDDYVSYSKAGD